MIKKARIVATALTFSAAGVLGLMQSESFAPTAIKPIPEDRWTYGYGSTFKEDGSPVQPGDTISQVEARRLMEAKVHDEYQPVIQACASGVPMTQGEFDALIDLAYHVGAGKVCRFSIVPKFRAGKYEEGCKAILTVDMLNGRHCNLPENRNRRDGCRGVIERRQRQFNMCMSK